MEFLLSKITDAEATFLDGRYAEARRTLKYFIFSWTTDPGQVIHVFF